MTDITTQTEVEKEDQPQRIAAMIAKVVTMVVYAYVLVVEIILSLGFVLLLFGANPGSGFVDWVYRSMSRAMKPFRGIFSPIELGETGNDVPAVLDTSVLFAMIIYAIVAVTLSSLLQWLTTRINRIDRANQNREVIQAHEDAERAYREAALRSQAPVQPAPAPGSPSVPSAIAPSGTVPPPAAPAAPLPDPHNPPS